MLGTPVVTKVLLTIVHTAIVATGIVLGILAVAVVYELYRYSGRNK